MPSAPGVALDVSGTPNGPSTVALLPVLPDPSSLWSSPGPSTLFLLQEARAHIAQLRVLKDHCQTGRIGYPLAPPANASALPPLPSIPVPRTTSAPPIAVDDRKSSGPDEKPPIASTSKLAGKTLLNECLQAFTEENEGWSAEMRHGGEAVCIRGKGLTVWALVCSDGEAPTRASSVRVYTSGDQRKGKGKEKEAPDLSSAGWNAMLSDHLTSLDLTMPELLYRLPHLPALLRQPCHRCLKYLKVPDGLPYGRTGYLPVPGSAQAKERDKGELSGEGSGGRWVCWHESCGSGS